MLAPRAADSRCVIRLRLGRDAHFRLIWTARPVVRHGRLCGTERLPCLWALTACLQISGSACRASPCGRLDCAPRAALLQPLLDPAPQPQICSQAGCLRPPRSRPGLGLGGQRPVAATGTVTADLPADRGRVPAQPGRDRPVRFPRRRSDRDLLPLQHRQKPGRSPGPAHSPSPRRPAATTAPRCSH
jgi:hypothetical protein